MRLENLTSELEARVKSLEEKMDELKAKNPDVPCPVCGGSGGIASCPTCNHTGTVPLTKAQEYRIRELEAEIKRLDK